ncbi:MAG TPA: hypothetical protein PK503_02620 [Azonexus sp.]|nr:hypothetical protein [Azonexus sp.]
MEELNRPRLRWTQSDRKTQRIAMAALVELLTLSGGRLERKLHSDT